MPYVPNYLIVRTSPTALENDQLQMRQFVHAVIIHLGESHPAVALNAAQIVHTKLAIHCSRVSCSPPSMGVCDARNDEACVMMALGKPEAGSSIPAVVRLHNCPDAQRPISPTIEGISFNVRGMRHGRSTSANAAHNTTTEIGASEYCERAIHFREWGTFAALDVSLYV